MVTVAAPGFGVVGPLAGPFFGAADGTSPATAFVAAVAAAAYNCGAGLYADDMAQLKRRLVQTGRPVLWTVEDPDGVAYDTAHRVVVVDPTVAVLDPRFHYTLGRAPGAQRQAATEAHWCQSRLQLRHARSLAPFALDTARIWRLMRSPEDSREWFAFVTEETDATRRGAIFPIGPLLLDGLPDDAKLLRLSGTDGTGHAVAAVYTVSSLKDVVVALREEDQWGPPRVAEDACE
jgi:hypothetical protein